MNQPDFCYSDERFADIQLLRYRLNGFEKLSRNQKLLVYYLSEAALCGRDITTDQYCKYNLRIRKLLECVYKEYCGDRENENFLALEIYLKRLWFSNGIHHHYGCEKFTANFSEAFLLSEINKIPVSKLPLLEEETVSDMCNELFPVIFDPSILNKRVNKTDGEDLVLTSACNFYENLSQHEAEDYYAQKKKHKTDRMPSFGLNSKLVKENGEIKEVTWKVDGLYDKPIQHIIYWLEKSLSVAENSLQREVIELLIDYYKTGDLSTFDDYSIKWLSEVEGQIDFINGFIEVYGDPLGIKGTWESLVEFRDVEATKRTKLISSNAQWFEDNSPIDKRFKKAVVKGVSANVICAAMLGGEEYPSTAIGINLPNADWIRAEYGSKSITISNITEAYNKSAKGNGFLNEFVVDDETRSLIEEYGDVCDNLHTDLHECLGHGSGQLLPDVDPDALKAYGSTIEEARADLFGLYYIADDKMVELGLLPDKNAYKAQYYTYLMNGLMTQLTRITPGNQIEEAHMRNRALISRWVYKHSCGAVKLIQKNGKTYVKIEDYNILRDLYAKLLMEIQRIKSKGDFTAARNIVEEYAIKVDSQLHEEILNRYSNLNIAPYKGFINPRLSPVHNEKGEIEDIIVDYTESYVDQMLRYSSEYGYL